MSNKYHHIAIALSGICQSAMLVPKLANSGQCSTYLYDISLNSIFDTDPVSTIDVFGGVDNIKEGLTFLTNAFNHNQQEKIEIMRYVFGAINVTSKLIKNDDALTKISQRLTRIKSLYDYEHDHAIVENHRDEISYSLAGIYSDIISPLTTKIRVNGKVECLQNTLVQAKVRSALFASVRAAILWYQVGGNRLQLILMRKNIAKAAKEILQQNQ
ncbi:high frequency lysogenization protein HflD [Orbus mooreae]|uniref:high frequency lysogenization protein HflD n=1 Tax=Orbus mooreae TaxID=3074107 RepID=UPI00370D8839